MADVLDHAESREVPMKVGKNGKLFGSVGSKDISKMLIDQYGDDSFSKKMRVAKLEHEIDGRWGVCKEARAVGDYRAMIDLHEEVSAFFKFSIVSTSS
jgi:large subunit ribosomal protein L9